jgi:hypothetical protein
LCRQYFILVAKAPEIQVRNDMADYFASGFISGFATH